MAVKKKALTYNEQYEQIKKSRSEPSLSREEHIAKRLREAEETDLQHPEQIDWVETMASEKNSKDHSEGQVSSLETTSHIVAESSIRRKSLVTLYTEAIKSLKPQDLAVLKFLYFGGYHPFQLSVSVLTRELNIERLQIRRIVFRLTKLSLITFKGFSLGKNNPMHVGLLGSVKTFLVENKI